MSVKDKHASAEAFTHALEVFEVRNRAFRVLYDTVIEIQGVSTTETYEILNRNLRRLCDADCTALATFDEESSIFTLEAIAGSLGLNEDFSQLRRATHQVSQDVIDELKSLPLQECSEHQRCLGAFFPALIEHSDKTQGHHRHYRISCVRGGRLLATGLIRYDRDQNLPVKDLVDTYVSLAGMIIQQVKSRRVVAVSESRYRRLFETNPLGIVMVDNEGNITAANPASHSLAEGKEEEFIGRSFLDAFIDKAEQERVWTYLQQVGGLDGPGRALEVHGKAADGGRRLLRLTADPTQRLQLSTDGMIICLEDVTCYRRMEDELLRAQKLESVGVLAGGIAHDFNNLLTVIMGNTSLLQTGICSPFETQKLLEAVDGACQRARELTGKLLTFSKGGAPVKRKAPIGELIEDAATFSLSGANVNCSFDFPEDLWPAEVDPLQINQVVSSVVLNGIDAMPHGGTLRIRAENVRINAVSEVPLSPGAYVCVRFADQGPGIKADIIERVFDPFFTTKENGTGLGLATVYSIIKQHGGLVTASSPEGGGAIISIYLPADSQTGMMASDGEQDEQDKALARVLVVDDEQPILELATLLLEQLDLAPVTAKSGMQGVELYRQEYTKGKPFDLVIMDLTIPGGIGGTEALQEILAIEPAARVIVSSGYSNAPVLERYRDFGFVGVLRKPYGAAEFVGLMRELLGLAH